MNSICVFNQICLSSFTRSVSLICDHNLARPKTWILFACNVDLLTNLTEKCFVKERKKGGAKVTKVRVLSMGCNLHVAFICCLPYIFHIYILK